MDTFHEILTRTPIVIDNGSGVIKAGFAGEDQPSQVFPSQVGRPKHMKVIPTKTDADVYVGKGTEQFRGLLKLKYPMSHGVVTNWADMELLWKHTYSELKVSAKEHPVLLTEAPLNPFPNKAKMATMFFESFNVPALFISVQAILSLYANGKTTGVVLDIGDGVSHALPVFEGFSIPHAISRSDIAGRDITEYLTTLLRRSGYNFHTSAEFELVKKIKEKCCLVSPTPVVDERGIDDKKLKIPYFLPDGNQIELSTERTRAPEILFYPDRVGLEYPSVHELLVNSIMKADIDLRKTLYGEVYLAGGTTTFQGFPERLIAESRKIAPKDMKIKVHAPPERQYSCWVGGSILSALASFKKMWITKKEFEDNGERILAIKSF